ncbi:hypothetical protein P3S67_021794 [Capsicum chacoense]
MLLVPWLCKSDKELIFPNHLSFRSPEVQELYICNCLEEQIGVKVDFRISFYLGKFPKGGWSIIPAGDTSQFIPSRDADIALLEEPEHLNWYHPGFLFIVPSFACSDARCTAVAEPLQWGNSDHPSDEYSKYSRACLIYTRTEDVVAKFKEVMSGEPQPLTPEEQYKLSSDVATQRFMEYSSKNKTGQETLEGP